MLRKSVNRYPGSEQIGDKDFMYRHLLTWTRQKQRANYPQNNQLITDIDDIVPLTFSFRRDEIGYHRELQRFAHFFIAEERKVGIDKVKAVDAVYDQGLKENIPIFYQFTHVPLSQVPKVNTTFENVSIETIKKRKEMFQGHNLWILKASGCDRGLGIEIFNSLEILDKLLTLFCTGYPLTEYVDRGYTDSDTGSPTLKAAALSNPSTRRTVEISRFIIQKYLESPALYLSHKFDIRAHCLLFDNCLYIFRDSYVRVSALAYSPSSLNYYSHLCNTAVNMGSQSFGRISTGNTIGIQQLCHTLSPLNGASLETRLFDGLSTLARSVFSAVSMSTLNPQGYPHCLELYGLDYLLTDSLQPILTEVNFIPGLTDEDNQYLKAYLDRMIDDMLKISIDQWYPRPRPGKRNKEYFPFMNFKPDENLWKFVCKYEN